MPGALVVTGRIATLAGSDGPEWVDAIAIEDGRVVAAGTLDDVEPVVRAGTRRLDLEPDEVALPGLTDAHLHLADAALARLHVDLEGCTSVDALVGRVRDAAALRPGERLEGSGWDADLLGRWPTASDLEAAAPGRLVALWAHDHHSLLVSEAAMRDAGVTASTPDRPRGVIRRDEAGDPTGVLHEGATTLVTSRVPAPSAADLRHALRPLIAELLALGVVAVHDPGGVTDRSDLGGAIEAYRGLAAAADLGVRLHACIRAGQLGA